MLALAILCVALVILAILTTKPKRDLTGFWEADHAFKHKSKLSDFYIYIGPIVGKRHPSYILMIDETKRVVINKPISISIKHNKFICHDLDDVMPSKMNMTVNDGVMELHSNKTIHAHFIKNNMLSHVCKPVVESDSSSDESDDE